MRGRQITLMALIFSLGIATTSSAGQWKQEDGWRYQQDDGSYIVSDWYTGSDGNSYYLDYAGVMSTGWYQVNSKWFYADNTGAIAKNIWIEDNGDFYYLQADGSMAINTNINGFKVGGDGKRVDNAINYEMKTGALVTSLKKSGDNTIPPGQYLANISPDVPHVRIINGSECIVDKYNFVELFEGDIVEVGGIYVPANSIGELDITTSGMFRVGIDIAEGTYTVNPPPRDNKRANIAICTVFNSIPSSKDGEKPEHNISSEDYVSSSAKQVTVKNGQYLQLINCSANLTRPN